MAVKTVPHDPLGRGRHDTPPLASKLSVRSCFLPATVMSGGQGDEPCNPRWGNHRRTGSVILSRSMEGGSLGATEKAGGEPETQTLIYEANPKHKPVPAPGRHGSICPRQADGPALLLQSELVGRKRYATDGVSAYCAQQHAADKWHGYPVNWDEVPPSVVAKWVAADKVERKMIRRAKRRPDR